MDNFDSKFFNEEAERNLLGIIILKNDLFDNISTLIKSDFFYFDIHKNIFSIIEELLISTKFADPITIYNASLFNKKNKKNEAEELTHEYLMDLIQNPLSFSSLSSLATLISNLFTKRRLLEVLDNIKNDLDTIDDVYVCTNNAESSLFSLSEKITYKSDIKYFSNTLDNVIEHAKKARENHDGVSGLPTNLVDVDNKLGGMQNSDLIIIAGRPSMGKTALATNIAYNIASNFERGGGVAFFSLEMSAEQLVTRILSQEANVPSDKIHKGILKDGEINRLTQVSIGLKKVPLYIDDTAALTINEMRTKCRQLKRKHDIKMVVVDYIQLLSGGGRPTDNRVNEISSITRGLKSIAKELNLPIIALSQLSRAVEGREDKIPLLSDLRESGSIEQDADIVSFVYRAEYYLSREQPQGEDPNSDKYRKWQDKLNKVKNLATLIIAKNRQGPICNIDLRFNSEFTKFENLTSRGIN